MTVQIITGDCRDVLHALPDESVHCVVTSPPYYGLRDYQVAGQIGLEVTPAEYLETMVAVFREVRRVLRKDGTCWLNLGDSYVANKGMGNTGRHASADAWGGDGRDKRNIPGLKPKDMIGIPWRVAFALQADGWYLRQDIIWNKPAPMPESVRDRCTKSHEYIFLLSKSERYYYDADAIKEPTLSLDDSHPSFRPNSLRIAREGRKEFQNKHEISARSYSEAGRNKRSVWTVTTQPFSGAHFATMPPALIEPCIKAGTSEKGCCAKCGAPLVREIEKTTEFRGGSGAAGRSAEDTNASGKWAGKQFGKNIKLGPCVSTETIGWAPSCSCNAAIVPCTVLDPFGGAGTTGLVADRLQRNAVLVEFNPEYATMARRRIDRDAPLFAHGADRPEPQDAPKAEGAAQGPPPPENRTSGHG